MKIASWPVEKITPHKGNPHKNDGMVEKVAASIKEFGFRFPIIVDKEGEIIAGHTWFLAALRLGMKKVPVHVALGLAPAQAESLRRAFLAVEGM